MIRLKIRKNMVINTCRSKKKLRDLEYLFNGIRVLSVFSDNIHEAPGPQAGQTRGPQTPDPRSHHGYIIILFFNNLFYFKLQEA